MGGRGGGGRGVEGWRGEWSEPALCKPRWQPGSRSGLEELQGPKCARSPVRRVTGGRRFGCQVQPHFGACSVLSVCRHRPHRLFLSVQDYPTTRHAQPLLVSSVAIGVSSACNFAQASHLGLLLQAGAFDVGELLVHAAALQSPVRWVCDQ